MVMNPQLGHPEAGCLGFWTKSGASWKAKRRWFVIDQPAMTKQNERRVDCDRDT
jgi:hypothetical protein